VAEIEAVFYEHIPYKVLFCSAILF
jgi:hypothetical protein